jgi:hypothetical protein
MKITQHAAELKTSVTQTGNLGAGKTDHILRNSLIMLMLVMVLFFTGCQQTLTGDIEALKGQAGIQGIQGIQGVQGVQGVPGDNGTNGANGNMWFHETDDPPDPDTGNFGDFCLIDSGNVYYKSLPDWEYILSLKGAKGDQGDTGENGMASQWVKVNDPQWVIPGWSFGSTSTGTVTAGYVYYVPIVVSENHTYLKSGVSVSAGGSAGRTIKFRIYEWDDGYPGAEVTSVGEITLACSANGLIENGTDITLSKGYYFIGYEPSYGFQLVCASSLYPGCPFQTWSTGIGGSTFLCVTGGNYNLTDPATIPGTGYNASFAVIFFSMNRD